jgi:hypothetical protein
VWSRVIDPAWLRWTLSGVEPMSEQLPPQDPLRAFTFVGRLLLIATLLVAGGVFYWFVMFVNDNLPSGHYPVAFLLIPVVIGAAVFFFVVSLILQLMGIRVWRETDDHNQ